MKMINGFIILAVAAACAGCATQPSRTLSALPDAATARQTLRPPVKSASGDYAGYQRIVVDGQERYCRKNEAANSLTESKVVCVTESQLRTDYLLAQQARLTRENNFDYSAPTPNLNSLQTGVQLQQAAANMPGYVGH